MLEEASQLPRRPQLLNGLNFQMLYTEKIHSGLLILTGLVPLDHVSLLSFSVFPI